MSEPKFLGKFLIWREKHLPHRQFVYILSFAIGIMSGLAAVLLKNVVHFIQHQLKHMVEVDQVNWFYFISPLVGIFLTILFVKYLVKDNIGHGVSKILFAISKKNGKIKPHNNYSSLIASSLTVGFGGSVGLEAPIVLTGASLGSTFSRIFKMSFKTTVILIGCGAAGAIAGIFKAPIAAVIFALEVLMLDLTVWSLIPLLISSVTGLSVAYFFSDYAKIFTFEYHDPFVLHNIPYFILLGIFCGFASLYFTRVTMFIESICAKVKNDYIKWIGGGVLLGIVILFIPPLYGEGYDTLDALLNGNPFELLSGSIFFGLGNKFWIFTLFLILILLFKVVATALTTGSGGIGGIFAPSLFIGGISGYFLARVINLFDFINVSERNFALVGMAGMMAGVMHAPLTAIFLIAEITGGYGLFLPLMITSTFAFITIMYFQKHSIYHIRLAQRGELLTHHKDQTVLRLMDIEKVIEKDFIKVSPDDKLDKLVKAISQSKRNIFPIVKDEMLVGIVLLDDIRHIIFNQDMFDCTYVRDLMTLPPTYVSPKDQMEEVMEKFEETGSWNLPVLENGKYIGFLSKSKLFSVYREWLIHLSED
ncbi:MAG: chloride channel protein [Bacteroidales bacterium]|nr:chloride channel protein [Bacteroidales bacterium]